MINDSLILGIDLGTTNSLVGVVDSGFPIILADQHGSRLTPSAVYFGINGERLVGEHALRRRVLEPGRVVTSVKRLIGRRSGESQWAPAYDLAALGTTPIEVSSLILRHLRQIAEDAMGTTIQRAVITVPAYFNDAQRNATKQAGELAGLTVERILAEPTAAALAYGLDKLQEQQKVAVYDLGGGTFDVSILEIRDGVFHVLSTAGDTQLGGDDVDLLLARHLWKMGQWGKTEEFDQLPVEIQSRFIQAAEEAKKKLSGSDIANVDVPFFRGAESYQYQITREELEPLIANLIGRTIQHCRRALSDAKLSPSDLDEVILVGGSTRIPAVRAAVADFFCREPNLSQNPDEAIAKGAVVQAGILAGTLRQMVLLDVTPLSLGIETFGGLMNVIIPRNTTIPCKAGEMFTNAVAGQPSMLVRVLQGERELANDNWELGSVEVPLPFGPKGSARVGVQFAIDANGILQVLSRETESGKDTILEIKGTAVDVADERVEAMINESVEHAFDDMNERIWTEASLKSDELLRAIDEALALCGEVPEKEEILSIAAQVRQILNSGIHDSAALKAANKRLDDATQTIAVMLVEKAMEEALERKLSA